MAGMRHAQRRVGRWFVPAVIGLLSAACGGATASSSHQAVRYGTMQVDGYTRVYREYVPPNLPSKPVPLLVALHGGNQYGDALEQTTGFDSLAEADGFIVAYPNGHGQTWNAGTCSGYPNVSTDNEVHFIDALITKLSAGGRIDPSRVYLSGFSAGAAMAYTAACRLAPRIAGVAVVSGTMDLNSCHPQEPVSIMEIHGTADQELGYNGGTVGLTGAVSPPTPQLVQTWAALDACSRPPATDTGGSVQVTKWTGCAGGTTVVLQTVQGGDHNWYTPQLGGADASLDATQVVWQFLSPLRR
jgi:polyhydroxybutyrate depolymerase